MLSAPFVVFPEATEALAPSRKAAATSHVVGVVGGYAVPPGTEVQRLASGDLAVRDLSGLNQLIVDRATFEEAKGKPGLAQALNAFARRAPLTIVGATPGDLGLVAGSDVPNLPVGARATTVLRSGGATFEAVHEWDTPAPGDDIVRQAVAWWTETRSRYGGHFSTQTEWYTGGEWTFKYSTSYSYSTHPYGILSYRGDWYKSAKETSSSYDVWAVVFDTITDPGKSVWGNTWRTQQTWLTSDIDYYRYDHVILDSEPSTRSNVYSIDYQMGFGSGYPGGPSWIWNSYYSGYSVDPQDNSYYWNGDSFFQVGHKFAYGSGPANGYYTSEPGVVVQVNQGGCFKIPYQNRATWRQYSNDQYADTWIDSWRDVCP